MFGSGTSGTKVRFQATLYLQTLQKHLVLRACWYVRDWLLVTQSRATVCSQHSNRSPGFGCQSHRTSEIFGLAPETGPNLVPQPRSGSIGNRCLPVAQISAAQRTRPASSIVPNGHQCRSPHFAAIYRSQIYSGLNSYQRCPDRRQRALLRSARAIFQCLENTCCSGCADFALFGGRNHDRRLTDEVVKRT